VNDVFLSFTRTGHPDLARILYRRLTDAGLTVFMDEDVTTGESISDSIIEALNASKIMLVIYSASYNQRWACQWELMQACLTGAAEGSAGRRILIVNPEPGDEHITQAEVADSKFLRLDELHLLVERVREKLARAGGPMGAARRLSPPRWLPPGIPGAFGFTGRFTDLWAVHNALAGSSKPLTHEASCGPVAVVTGMPGIGKTSLAKAYGWLFGAAYPGGVFCVSAGGPGDLAVAHGRFARQIREIAGYLRIATAGEPDEHVVGLVADHLHATGRPSLWIVDDVPAESDGAMLGRFIIPAPAARTVFTTRSFGGGAPEIRLSGLGAADGLAVLRACRPLPECDLDAARSITRRLGGHPLALTVAGAYLRDNAGLISYADYDRSLASDGPDPDILSVIGRSMGTLTSVDRAVISLAGLLGPAPVPSRLIGAVLGALDPQTRPAAAALARLSHGGFAVHDLAGWQIHPLVVEAAARLGSPLVPAATVAAAAARELASLLAASPDDSLLIRHARTLADNPDVTGMSPARVLDRLVADYSERIGDLAQAAARAHRVAQGGPGSAADQVGAALACVANGEFGRGIEHARLALSLWLTGEQETRARWALAAGLDGLGRFGEAGELWAWLAEAGRDPGEDHRVAFGVARARALLARGELGQARPILEGVLDRPGTAGEDQVNAARIEMARLLLWTSREREGRELAESVVRYYQDRGAPGHARCMEAGLVWAEATVSLALFELRPDTSRWAEAEALLARLAADYDRSAGPHSIYGLTALVQQGLMCIWLGKPRDCREILRPAEAALRARYGDRHPLLLRGRYALGLAHFQLSEFSQAAEVLGGTWRVQREVIGPRHPDTLHSQLQYGIALKLASTPESAHSAGLIRGVMKSLPKEMGRKNDLYGQAWMANVLLPLTPAAVVRNIRRLDRTMTWLRKR
jgi:hypothetical protein